MFDTQCSSFDIQSIRIPCIRPTVHLICGHSRATVGLYAGETVCFVLSTKYFSSSTEYKSFGFPSYSPTVHLICRHSRATIGMYDGETVCFVPFRNPSVHRPNTNYSDSRHTAQRCIWYTGTHEPPLGCMTGKPCAFGFSHRTQWLDLA